ncbi:MAG: hypothetical protein P8Y70_13090 [Candidatus Lokiarchaeota archaeon]
MKKDSKSLTDEELDDLLDQQFEKQSEIHKVCKMKEKKKHSKF